MRTHVIKGGDTFTSLSRQFFGTEDKESDISQANPGVVEPLIAGGSLNIPDSVLQISSGAIAEATDPDDIVLEIDGVQFKYWEGIKTTSQIDAFDSLEFSTVFDLNNVALRNLFKPFSYKSANIMIGGERHFTGTIVNPMPQPSPDKLSISVSAYARPGVLMDCQFPISVLTEFAGGTLMQITKALIKPFGLTAKIVGDQGPVFDQVEPDTEKKMFDYFTDLAKQRGFVISNTPEGEVLYWKSIDPGAPVARLVYGQPPATNVSPEFNPQEYYSHITGTQMSVTGIEGSTYTMENKRLPGVLRPYTFEFKDINGPGIEAAVAAKLGRMLGNAVVFNVDVIGWRDPAGKLWRPNTTVTLLAPEAMVYRETEFIIRRVELNREDKSKTATLSLVLPGSFSGKIPEVMPWD